MKTYKIWVQIEEVDEKWEKYENVSEPVCIGAFDTYGDAHDRFMGLALAFGGLDEGEMQSFRGVQPTSDWEVPS